MALTSGKTVGEIAAENPAAARVFESYNIDYCCGGQRPLQQVCREQGISAEDLLAEVEKASAPAQQTRHWNSESLAELADHIVSRHHAYLRAELPALSRMIAKVIAARSEAHSDSLVALRETFEGLERELLAHMRKEEMVLFPLIKELELSHQTGVTVSTATRGFVQHPIRVMEYEHDSAGMALAHIRRVTSDYTLPADACATYRALFDRLQQLESDLHLHIHLENNILFPRALQIA